MMKKMVSLALALVLCLGLAIPAGALGTGHVSGQGTISASSYAYIDTSNNLMMWEGDSFSREIWEDNPSLGVFAKVMSGVKSFATDRHIVVLKTDGTLWCWGYNDRGQVGIGTASTDNPNDPSFYYVRTPTKIMDNVAAVACNQSVTAAIKTDGSLWMWGDNRLGQLGNGTLTDSSVPIKVMDDVVDVSIGGWMTAAVKSDGSLWTWGANHYGHLGNSGVTNATGRYNWECLTVPTKIMDDVVTVSCGGNFCAAIKSDGSLWTWGLCENGNLGDGNVGNVTYLGRRLQNVPNKIMDDVASVSCGSYHTLAVKTDGSLWAWGRNRYGELGNGGVGDEPHSIPDGSEQWFHQTVPTKVMEGVAEVDCCENQSFILKTDGTLLVCGQTYGFPVDTDGLVNYTTPVKVADNVLVPAKPSPTVAGFSDVHESDYFAEAVAWAKDSGITGGTTATTFSPASTVTRAQAVTFLWRAAGSPQPSTTVSPFSDVTDPSAYYYNAVLWAAEQGITTGVTATTFGTGSAVAYDQMLAFLARAAGADTGSGSWSDAAISWAADNGLTDGLDFTAKGSCPRADVVFCLWKQLA